MDTSTRVFDEWACPACGERKSILPTSNVILETRSVLDPHSVKLLKSLPRTDGQLRELGMQSSSYDDGADSSSSYELVWIADPAGKVALKVDSRTGFNGVRRPYRS